MDRKAVLLNLRDLRDLELTKIVLTTQRIQDWNLNQQEIDKLRTAHYIEPTPLKEHSPGRKAAAICGVAMGLLLFLYALRHLGSGEGRPPFLEMMAAALTSPGLCAFCMMAGVPLLLVSGCALYKELACSSRKEEIMVWNTQANTYNAEERARVAGNLPRISELLRKQKAQDAYWSGELETVEALLQESYQVNFVPPPYRNKLTAIQYLYAAMASGPASFSRILHSIQQEADIRRMEETLDILMPQQRKRIFTRHRQEAQNEQAVAQNKLMLESLRRAESNPLEAAQYAQLSSSYSKICAFFAAASYLEEEYICSQTQK